MAKALTAKAIENMKAGSSRKEIPDGGMPGLYLIVQPKRERDGKELLVALSWAIRYRFDGRPRKFTIGSYPKYGLAEAREAASASLRSVTEGRTPIEEKAAREAERTDERNLVPNVLDDFIKKHVDKENRESTAKNTKAFINNEIRPQWKARSIQSIKKRDVIELLEAIGERGAPESAARVRAILSKFFNWCVDRDIINASPLPKDGIAKQGKSRERVLSDDELRWLWAACKRIGHPFGPMVQLLIVTVQRRNEVSGACRSELDLGGNHQLWTIPPARTKNGKEHLIPLSGKAIEIIKSLPKIGDLLFTTTGETAVSGFSRAKESIDKAMLNIAREEAVARGDDNAEQISLERWTLHDLRRTAATGMAKRGLPIHVVEAVLNHQSGTLKGVAKIYNRYSYLDEKREALSAWERYVIELVDRPAV